MRELCKRTILPLVQSPPVAMVAVLVAAVGGACGQPGDAPAGEGVPRTTSNLYIDVGVGPTVQRMNFFFCANENQSCLLGGTKYVAFGSGHSWVFKSMSGNVSCTPSTFGGQSPSGSPRACWYAPYTYMFSESNTPRSGIFNEVAFGVDGAFSYKRVSGTWRCDLSTFPEPDPLTVGKTKACYEALRPYGRIPTGQPVGANNTPVAYGGNGVFLQGIFPASSSCDSVYAGAPFGPFCYKFPYAWVQSEGSDSAHTFTVTSSSTLYYGTGLDGNFLTRFVAPGTYQCSNSVAGGDPAIGATKQCYLASAN